MVTDIFQHETQTSLRTVLIEHGCTTDNAEVLTTAIYEALLEKGCLKTLPIFGNRKLLWKLFGITESFSEADGSPRRRGGREPRLPTYNIPGSVKVVYDLAEIEAEIRATKKGPPSKVHHSVDPSEVASAMRKRAVRAVQAKHDGTRK